MTAATLRVNPHQHRIRVAFGVLYNHVPLLISPLHGVLLNHRYRPKGEFLDCAKYLADASDAVQTAQHMQ